MNCMKCGRELSQEGVFCDECLAEMDRYPVKPDAVVQLPRKRTGAPVKKSAPRRKTHRTPEEQIKHLRRLVLRLAVALFLCLSLLIAAGYFTVIHLLEERPSFLPGQNYSSMESTEPAAEE